MSARFNLEPFASPGYRRYFIASTLAALAIWIYQPSVEWIVLTRTGQAAAVGLLQTALIVAIALATLPSGVLTDRFGARRMLTVSLIGIGASVAAVAAAAFADLLTFETALALTFVLGIFDGLYSVPVVLLLAQIVEPRYLGSAIGLSFLTSGIGRLVGGPLGGTVLQVAGPAAAFVPAAVVLAISAAVVFTTPVLQEGDRRARSGGAGLRTALRYLPRDPVVLAVTALATLSAASVFAYSALLPAYTRDALGGSSATLGLLSGAGGVGTIAGALAMETVGRRLGRGRTVLVSFLGAGLVVGALGLSQALPVSLALAAAITFLAIIFGGTAQLLIQTVPPPNLRAGVIALYTFLYYCLLPIATALVGALADLVGVAAVMVGMAALTVIGATTVVLLERRILTADVPAHEEVAGMETETAPATAAPRAGTPEA